MDGFHIFEALNSCRHLLAACGGHQAAAGFDMPLQNLEAFRTAIQEYSVGKLDEDALQPTLYPDAELAPRDLELRLAHDLAAMEPFGHGNHEPLFVTRGLKVLEQRRLPNKVQTGIDHLKLKIQTDSDRIMDALFWRAWPRAAECLPGSYVDLCHTVELNRHNGYTNLQLNLKDLRPAE
jgi:single-stranded-DNA-specific exonuclease